jgi:hypothetical protein
MQIDIYGRADRDIVDAIHKTWQRLPLDAQRALDHVTFTAHRHPERTGWASAGPSDIDICTLPLSAKAALGVIAHECAHVALSHPYKLRSGAISAQQAEQEADALVRRWRLADELLEAYIFKGR